MSSSLELWATLSPYLTGRLKRYGDYIVDFDNLPQLDLLIQLVSRFVICEAVSFRTIDVLNNTECSRQSLFRGKTSVDWFYGFKLHLAINHQGELLNVALTTGNVDDRKPVKELLQGQHGQFFGDKGYISAALARDLRESSVILVTKSKKRMKNKLMTMLDKQLLRKIAVVEFRDACVLGFSSLQLKLV